MRKSHGRVVKKYSRNLKAESLHARIGRSPGLERSHQSVSFGGFVSPNHGARVACSGIQGSGSQSVPSKSVTGGGAAFRNHVNNMVLRGKLMAGALTYENKSCEIMSRVDGKVVEKNSTISGGGSSDGRIRGARFESNHG
ncbi:hypothetical protein CCACVL1_05634 [Corchorus capsularis]|uniref:Uncharacterized protein n=1 Tax=Corchorus capsularis TaxID=210143 RepID=A0A1R3JJS2_COCAP|nr:hypothetical protein CCACVL1_05634 [Corchorus capsularis]